MPPVATPTLGQPAPDFAAPATGGETVTLAQFRQTHRVVLSFYPRDFSSGCTRQLCSYRDGYGEVTRRRAIVVGVSRNSPDSQAAFAERNRLPFPLISDRDGTIARRYGVLRLGGLIPFPRRVTFVIDEEGIIRGILRHELAVGRHLKEALAILDEIAAGRAEQEGS
jgi:peroxiredoxin Q/BCP